ncbi:MAG TPA: long-chain fatty acid--CoA ligase [Acetobacteraceae bacterium]|nr:long-chain fatty acid--CoA ligase [Acetobacteraceae bacterium]
MQSTMMAVPLLINSLIPRAVRLFPDREIVSRLSDKSLRRHSYRDFARRVHALASALRTLGVRPGDRVATLCWNHHVHLECYFGIPLCGAVLHTLNLRLFAEEIGWIADDGDDTVLIVDNILQPLFSSLPNSSRFKHVIWFDFDGTGSPGDLDYETFIGPHLGQTFEPPPHHEDDAILLCYTSGTTGRPKGVAYSHRSAMLHSLAVSLPDGLGLRNEDAILPVTPMFHAACWGTPYAGVMVGAKFIFPGPHLHAEDLLDLMQEERPSFALGVPTIWLSVLQAIERDPSRASLLAGLRTFTGGSAPPPSLIRAFRERGASVMQAWGMTETSPICTISYVKSERRHAPKEEQIRVNTLAGVPVPLVELRLMGESGECPADGVSAGEVQARGPFITGSYFGRGYDPATHTEDGWLRTGDVAVMEPDGYLKLVDRTKDLIKSGGEWISSVDLENALMAHPAVAEAAVIAIAHPVWGERPLACVVRKPGEAVTADTLDEHLRTRFAKWQLPERFEFLEAIPRTSTGKFSKSRLRELYAR